MDQSSAAGVMAGDA